MVNLTYPRLEQEIEVDQGLHQLSSLRPCNGLLIYYFLGGEDIDED